MKTEPCPDCGGERRYVPATDSHPAHLSCLTCIRRAVEDDHEPGIGDRTRDLLFGLMTVATWIGEFSNELGNSPPDPVQTFDVWSFGKASDDAGTKSHFGRMPPQVVENLLWLYTSPLDIVFDPFAGGGGVVIGSQLSVLASYADHIGRAAGWEPDPGFDDEGDAPAVVDAGVQS